MKKEKLEKEFEETNEMLDVLLDIIIADDNSLKYNKLVHEALEIPVRDRKAYIEHYIDKWNYQEKLYCKEVEDTAQMLEDKLKEVKPESTKRDYVNLVIGYIEERFTYERTDASMYNFVETCKGQCVHIATYFKDLCENKGIRAYILKGSASGANHAWNKIILEDREYYFDLTWNMTGQEEVNGYYKWLSREEMLKDHLETIVVNR